jgi:hypothetical protein
MSATAWKFINAPQTGMTEMKNSQPFQNSFPRRPEWIAAILLTAIAVWLHTHFLACAGGLWRDEVSLVNLSNQHSIGDMAKDSFPILMPVMLHGWMAIGFGRSDLSLRCLGIIVGLAIPAALWTVAWTARRAPPLLGLVLLAMNSTAITYGDSLRAYGLGSALIVFSAAGALWFLRRPNLARAGLLAVLAISSVQSLYQNAILVGAICAGAGAVCARRKFWRAAALIFAAGAAAVASLLPYVPNLISGRSTQDVLRVGVEFSRVFENLTVGAGFPQKNFVFVWALFVLVVIVSGCAVLFCKSESQEESRCDLAVEDARLFAGTTAFAALAGFSGFVWFAALPTEPWYFLPLLALLAACFDAGLPPLSRCLRLAPLCFVTVTALFAVPVAQRNLSYRATNADSLARFLAAETSSKDFILVTPWYCGISFDHYFKSPTPWTTVPPVADHAAHRYDLVRVEMQMTNAIQPMLDQAAAALQSGHRVWIVVSEGWMNIPAPGETPIILPPPPLKDSGWSDLPYTYAWNTQVAGFLAAHSREFGRLKNSANGDVRNDEKLELFTASGWKDSAQPVSTSQTNKP